MSKFVWVSNRTQVLHGQSYDRNDIHPQIRNSSARAGVHGDWTCMEIPAELEQYTEGDFLGSPGIKVNEEGDQRTIAKDDTILSSKVDPIKEEKIQFINNEFNQQQVPIVSGYPSLELLSFYKAILAREWNKMTSGEKTDILNGTDPDGQKVFALIIYEAGDAPTEAEVDAVVENIINNAGSFGEFVGKCIRTRKTTKAEVTATTGTYDEVRSGLDGISPVWPTFS